MSSAENEYLFEASLPALGYNTYYFQAKGILLWNYRQISFICFS
jgi:hypothetical protein